ncbi:MAG: hypothetical protein K0R47_5715, partial [Brevibacillus sp.]|nr:hypothetical protein [Brevibacillus sp.]
APADVEYRRVGLRRGVGPAGADLPPRVAEVPAPPGGGLDLVGNALLL